MVQLSTPQTSGSRKRLAIRRGAAGRWPGPLAFRILAAVTAVALAARAAAQVAANPDFDQLKQLSLEDLMQTSVSSVSLYPEKLLDVSSAIQLISSDDILRSGAPTIPDALRLADNLDISQKDPHDWAISARGFNSNLGDKMLVLVDGRTVYSPLFSGVFWNAQDYLMEDIDRIEVISGPGGTLWGANAVNGVINITTKSAQDTQGTYFEVGGGSELQDFIGGRVGLTLAPNLYFRVYAKELGYEDGPDWAGQDLTNSWHQGQTGFRLDDQAVVDQTVTLQGDFYSGNEDFATGGDARLAGGNVVGRWTRTVSADSDLSLELYWDRTDLHDPFNATPYGPFGYLNDTLDTYNLDFRDHLRLGPVNEVVWGVGGRTIHDDVRQEAPNLAFEPPVNNQSQASMYAQDDLTLAESWHLTFGTKVEEDPFTGLEVEPNVRLRWTPTPNQNWWAAISRAVRTPSYLDRDLSEPAPPQTLIAGSSNFDSETLYAYELGYRAQLSSQVSLSVSNFYNDYNRLRSLGITPATILPLIYQNNLAAWSYGTEVSMNYQATAWWRLHAGYDLLEEHVWIKPGQIDFDNALDETADPKNQVFVRSSLDLPHAVAFDAEFRYVDALRIDNNGVPGTVPAYSELNLRLGWRPVPHVELSVVGENLLHAYHDEFWLPGTGAQEIPRTIFAKSAWRF